MPGIRRTLIGTVACAITLGPLACPAQAEDCKLIRLWSAETLEGRGGELLVPVRQSKGMRYFMLDTGAHAGLIYQDVADAEGLKVVTTRAGIVGASGAEVDRVTSSLIVKGVQQYLHLADNRTDPWIYYVVDRPPGGDPRRSGTVGTNFYAGSDLEIDFPGRKVATYSYRHCDGKVVYWADDYLVMPLIQDANDRAFITVTLDGKRLRALIDTGATASSLSLDTAKDLFGLSSASPGVERVGVTRDVKNTDMATYRHQFAKLDIGGIAFNNTWLDVTDMQREPGVDMVLGRYHLRKLHLFFAYIEHKLYVTVGPEQAVSGADSYESAEWQRCSTLRGDSADVAISGCSTIINAGTQLKDHLALAYARRGEAYAAKGDQASAQRDFDAAFRTDPGSEDVLLIHGRALAARGERDAARRDLDKALETAPDRLDILLARADVEITQGAYAPAAKDLAHAVEQNAQFSQTESGADGTAKSLYQSMLAIAGTISKAQPALAQAHVVQADIYYYLRGDFHDQAAGEHIMPELDLAIAGDPGAADAYLRRAVRYRDDRHDLDRAAADLDQYLRLRPGNVAGLTQRCGIRALAGRLDDALADCNAALKQGPTAETYARRGFIHFKAGRFDQASADFGEAARISPKFSFALYGRGLARKASGDASGGDADIAAAKKIRADIDRTFYE